MTNKELQITSAAVPPANPAIESAPPKPKSPPLSAPSSLYREEFWRMGLGLVRFVPRPVCVFLSRILADLYWLLAPQRREIVIQNLLPALNNDRAAAVKKAKKLIRNFAV